MGDSTSLDRQERLEAAEAKARQAAEPVVGQDPKADINQFLERAYGTGHFMVLVLRRDDEGVKINRVTNDFKTADFLKAVELVAANLFAEQERIAAKPVVQPLLPRAYPFVTGMSVVKNDMVPEVATHPDATTRQNMAGCATMPLGEEKTAEGRFSPMVEGYDNDQDAN